MKRFTITSKDNKRLQSYSWESKQGSVRAALLVIHGMAEHAKRYHEFALFCNKKHISVYSFDLRGHGETVESAEELGVFSEKNAWECILADIKEYINIIHTTHPGIPLFLLGHSMGSLLVRDLLTSPHDTIKGCICTGTSGSPGIMGIIGLGLARMCMLCKGRKAKSNLFNAMLFGEFNKSVTAPETGFDWLSRDTEQVQRYIRDRLCGFVCSLSLYSDLIKGALKVNSRRRIKKIRKDLPLFLLSGDKDPVGGMGKDVHKVYHLYKNAGLKNVGIKLFKDFRHEILNETGNETVYLYIYEWIKKML